MARLSDAEIEQALAKLDGWTRTGDEIEKTYVCPGFPEAIAFVVNVGFLAEHANHHPDLDIRWRNVRVALTTHDANGLTDKDVDLATRIEQVSP